ncbi:hypothetical protein TNCV_913911 [Trichonephila clavipes]|nr:hypothetical protein TNCV_913911 [Trichonephila clavipes]
MVPNVAGFLNVTLVSYSRGMATDLVIRNPGQVTRTTSELAFPVLTTTPHQRKDVWALDRFKVLFSPTRRVFSGARLEVMTRRPRVRYLDH